MALELNTLTLDHILPLLPKDGSFIAKKKLLARLGGLSGHPAPNIILGPALRRWEKKGYIRTNGAQDPYVRGGWSLEVARAWPERTVK